VAIPITAIGGTPALTPAISPSSSPSATPVSGGFGEALAKIVESAESAAGDANQAVGAMLDKTGEVHDAMIAMQRAELSLQLTVQVRNKLVQAYQDIMRMPV
jgi:flagellar hook-basal body complex protein FliE